MADMTRREAFEKIEEMVNAAIAEARVSGIQDAVNWADLRCLSVEYFEDSDYCAGFRAIVSEAAPDATKLQAFIEERLHKADWYVSIRTEW